MKKQFTYLAASSLLVSSLLSGCSSSDASSGSTTINIYSANYEEEIAKELAWLNEQFPDYNITITYLSSGKLAAKLLAEGDSTDIDIALSLSSGYANQLKDAGLLLSFDTGVSYQDEFTDPDSMVIPNGVWAGAIVVNTQVLEEKGLPIPTSYADLTNPVYEGEIVMANPSTSSTGYFFLLGIQNLYGDEAGWQYWDQLSDNIMLFSESGSVPVTMVERGEAAIGLGIDYQAIQIVSDTSPVQVIFAEEGAPYDYDTALLINRGGEPSEAVTEVFAAITSLEGNAVFNNYNISVQAGDMSIEGYPDNFMLMDMTGISDSELKQNLLAEWSDRYE